MSRGLEPRSAPSAALMIRTSLLPGERLEGALQGWPSPLPWYSALWGHSAAREESFLPKDQCGYSVSFQTLTISTSDAGNTRGHILKVKVLLSRFWKWFRSPRILQLIWFSDGKVRCDSNCMSCTWSLREYLWCKEPRDQLDSGPDHAGWPVNSPVYTRF